MSAYTTDQLKTKGLSWTLGYLLPVIAAKTTLSYGRIAELLARDLKIRGRVFPTHIGGVAGGLMDCLHDYDESIPLINVLIVRQGTNQPSSGVDGYLRDWFDISDDPMPQIKKRRLVSDAAQEVYAYPHWERVYKRVFKKGAPAADPLSEVLGSEKDGLPPDPIAKRHGGESESKEHKLLKAYVLKHPTSIGLQVRPKNARDEFLLLSGDEVDVYFESEGRVDLVEVKSTRSQWNDLRRGIYQCVKYRAVFQAQCSFLTPDVQVVATLVTENEIPRDLQQLAALHEVKIKVVRVNP